MIRIALALFAAAALSVPAVAQDSDPDTAIATLPSGPSTAPIEDEIIVEGQRRGADAAMDAWLKGDYVTAEIEFEKNFSRLKVGERLRRTNVEQNASDAIQGQIFDGANTGSGSSEGGAAAGDNDTTFGAATLYTNQRFRPGDDDPNVISSGNDLGGQLYMAGLSEVKLGKYAEAKKSFERALFYNEYLFDARLRLGLLAVQDGDMKEAQKQLRKLRGDLNGCHGRCERFGDREILENAVAQLEQFAG